MTDRIMLLDHLEMTERHVALGERHVSQQRALGLRLSAATGSRSTPRAHCCNASRNCMRFTSSIAIGWSGRCPNRNRSSASRLGLRGIRPRYSYSAAAAARRAGRARKSKVDEFGTLAQPAPIALYHGRGELLPDIAAIRALGTRTATAHAASRHSSRNMMVSGSKLSCAKAIGTASFRCDQGAGQYRHAIPMARRYLLRTDEERSIKLCACSGRAG